MKSFGPCDTCGDKNGIGVVGSGLGPISFVYCSECATSFSEPHFMLEAVFEDCGRYVAKHVEECQTVINGKRITWSQFCDIKEGK